MVSLHEIVKLDDDVGYGYWVDCDMNTQMKLK